MKCTNKVITVLQACGHSVTKLCHTQLSDIICNTIVYDKGVCGHDLSRKCHMSVSQVVCKSSSCSRLRYCRHPCANKCSEPCDVGICSVCESEQEERIKESQDRAKIRLKELQQQAMETGRLFSQRVLEPDEGPEYLSVYDRVMKYIQPMHNWYPRITCIEKVHNLQLEFNYEKYRSQAFGDHEDLKFHGTSDAGVEGIIRNGFRIGKPGMYGPGIYFATDSSKSSQNIYTKGSNKLLLCKVFLGRAKTVDKADNSLTGISLRAEGFDSVFAPRGTKGMGGVVNDEFVVFDPRQAVAHYVIHYSSASTVSLPGARFDQLATGGQPFRKVRMEPGRSIKLGDPFDTAYRYAEGHFSRQMSKVQAAQMTISAITVVVNARLAANFEMTRKNFAKEKKGRLRCLQFFIWLLVCFFQCCGSGMIYSGSGYSFEFSSGSRQKIRVHADPDPTYIN